MSTVADFEKALHREIGAFRYDPLGFVMFAFPWGISHTPLAQETGPEEWQHEVLVRIGNGLLDGHFSAAGSEAVCVAIASGHGIGKSALVAWIIPWAMSTLHASRGVVHLHRDGAPFGRARPRQDLAGRRHHLVGAEHRGHRRPAQQGPPRLRPFGRGVGHPRSGVGHHRRPAGRRGRGAPRTASRAPCYRMLTMGRAARLPSTQESARNHPYRVEN